MDRDYVYEMQMEDKEEYPLKRHQIDFEDDYTFIDVNPLW